MNAALTSDCAMGEQGGGSKARLASSVEGQLLQWEVGKGAIEIRWTHEYAGVLAHIPESLSKALLGRIEADACG